MLAEFEWPSHRVRSGRPFPHNDHDGDKDDGHGVLLVYRVQYQSLDDGYASQYTSEV